MQATKRNKKETKRSDVSWAKRNQLLRQNAIKKLIRQSFSQSKRKIGLQLGKTQRQNAEPKRRKQNTAPNKTKRSTIVLYLNDKTQFAFSDKTQPRICHGLYAANYSPETDKGDRILLIFYRYSMIDDIVLIASSEILAHMVNCNPSRTPIDTESKMGSDGDPGSDPIDEGLQALKQDYDLKVLVRWVTTFFLATTYSLGPLSVSRRFLVLVAKGLSIVFGCCNVVAHVVYLSYNPVLHQRTKHIKIDIHFCDLVAVGQVRVLHVPSRYQFADIFTKGLPSVLFEEFRSKS
ncbi:ribonuclease H-like domain-containing protein [Tanacetum coccineum]